MNTKIYLLMEGLKAKSLKAINFVIKELVNKNISRDGIIVAIGGGVIGDLSAFVQVLINEESILFIYLQQQLQ